MKRCKCIRFKELQALRRESAMWLWSDQYGLVPVSCEYPLIMFDCGDPAPICPYYLYLDDDIRLANSFDRYRMLNDEHRKILDNAIINCEHRVPPDNVELIEDRHAEILRLYAANKDQVVDRELFLDFYKFIQIRQQYLDISPCLVIPPIEHRERMECINQAWMDAFKKYLEEKK